MVSKEAESGEGGGDVDARDPELRSGSRELIGQYEYTVDSKGRVVLPAPLRQHLGGAGVITKFLGGCLALFEEEQYEEFAERVRAQQRAGEIEARVARFIFWNSRRVKVDAAGRVAIPADQREWAGLTGPVTVVGNGTRIEIWNRSRAEDLDTETGDLIKQGQGMRNVF